MEIINLRQSFDEAVSQTVRVLKDGGVVLYPTDTIYGLGADALSTAAIQKVYALKARDVGKPLHCIVADLEMAAKYAIVNDAARVIARKFLPGPLTLVLKKRDDAHPALSEGRAEFAIRIPDSTFCLEIARAFGPFTTTSANLSGENPATTVLEILAQFADAAQGIDLIIDGGPAALGAPSTIVSLVSDSPEILREGAVPSREILGLF